MPTPTRHLTRCLAAGIVALLPLGGAVFAIVWLESAITSTWQGRIPFYFPGLGILAAALLIYLVGLCVTTFVGRFVWRRVDRLLEGLPLLGTFYFSLKEVLGYDTTRERFFRGVVAVPCDGGHEIGLVTGSCAGPNGSQRTLVFVPGSPNPTNGRLVLVDPAQVVRLEAKVADALRTMVSMGKSPLGPERAPATDGPRAADA